MNDANVRPGAPHLRREATRKAPASEGALTPGPSTSGQRRTADEISAVLHLAELDAALLRRAGQGRAPAHDEAADKRLALRAGIPHEILEAYERALRGGRQPAVVRLVASVCSGCHVRLHAKLDHQIRERRGIAPCPHCLRLVYDPAWVEG